MTRRIARFFALPRPERAVLLQALFWLPVTVLALRLRVLRVGMQASEMLRARRAGRHAVADVAPARVTALVSTAARRGLVSGNCLSQSLTLSRLLHSRGYTVQLRIGARRGAHGLEAHAWVEHEGRPLNDTADVGQRFSPFPVRSRQLPRVV